MGTVGANGLGGRFRQAQLRRRNLEPAHRAAFQHIYRGKPGYRQLVHAVRAVNHERLFAAEKGERARHLGRGGRVGHADNLPRRARRVGERAQDVEHGSDADFAAGRGGEAHGGMKALREHEAEADFIEASRHRFGRKGDFHAERFENVRRAGGAGHGAVAVLGDFDARARRDERRRRGYVEAARRIAARPAGIDHVAGGGDAQGFLAHRARHARDFVDGFALHAQGGGERAYLRGRGVAGHDRAHRARRPVRRQIAAGDDGFDCVSDCHVDSSLAAGIRRKFRRMSLPAMVIMDSG